MCLFCNGHMAHILYIYTLLDSTRKQLIKSHSSFSSYHFPFVKSIAKIESILALWKFYRLVTFQPFFFQMWCRNYSFWYHLNLLFSNTLQEWSLKNRNKWYFNRKRKKMAHQTPIRFLFYGYAKNFECRSIWKLINCAHPLEWIFSFA